MENIQPVEYITCLCQRQIGVKTMEAWQNTVLPKFQEMHPDLEIEFVNNSPQDVADNVGLAIQGGAGLPDMFVTGTEYGTKIVNLGGLTDLTEAGAALRGRSSSGYAGCLLQGRQGVLRHLRDL